MASAAAPDIQSSLCGGSTLQITTNGNCSTDTSAGTTGINNIITTVINVFSIVVGVVSVIMIILGGFRYITSGGESSNVTGAKNTIVYAIIGLVVVALAQFIVKYVLAKVTQSGTGN
jgi:cytochrome bd-type quinol oxidase subunit 2